MLGSEVYTHTHTTTHTNHSTHQTTNTHLRRQYRLLFHDFLTFLFLLFFVHKRIALQLVYNVVIHFLQRRVLPFRQHTQPYLIPTAQQWSVHKVIASHNGVIQLKNLYSLYDKCSTNFPSYRE